MTINAPQWKAERLDSDDFLISSNDKFWGMSMNEKVKQLARIVQDEGIDNNDKYWKRKGTLKKKWMTLMQ